jgi:3-oxoacyl-[acyl-carrier-protein] synthase II
LKRRVVVTGVGVVSPAGIGAREFWDACLEGRFSMESIPEFWKNFHSFNCEMWAKLPPIPRDERFMTQVEEKQLDTVSILGAYAAKQALEDCGLAIGSLDSDGTAFSVGGYEPDRMGVFTGTGTGGIQTLFASHAYHMLHPLKAPLAEIQPADVASTLAKSKFLSLMKAPRRFHPFSVAMSMLNAVSGTVSIKYNLTGPSRTFCSSCASGTVSIGQAYRAVALGEADMILAGGAEYLFDDSGCTYRGFDTVGALAKGCAEDNNTFKPFDRNRTGFLMAEGSAAYLVLETREAAIGRGARIYAEIAGYSESCDAYNKMAIEPGGARIKSMLEALLRETGLLPGDVQYINAHGTGTELNDAVEAKVMGALFGRNPAINSTKSITGHSIGASGALEAVATCLSIRDQRSHGCRGLQDPIADLDFIRSARELRIRNAISQSFGFGGHNAALLFKQSI